MAACSPVNGVLTAAVTYASFIITVCISMATSSRSRVLVTGGGTFLGDYIAAALVAEGADVTLLVRPGAEDRLGGLAERVRWATADVWDAASLRGRARGHQCVVHTVGSLLGNVALVVFVVIGIIMSLDAIGVPVGPLLASVGVLGLAVTVAPLTSTSCTCGTAHTGR